MAAVTAPIVGLLLAAGSSRRFGSDKLMQPLPEGDRVAVRACRNLLAGVDRVVAVVRPNSHELRERLCIEGAEVAICHEAAQGLGVSLAAGVRASFDAGGWLVALADMPWISPVTIRAAASAIRQGALLAAPSLDGRRGHPVGFAASYREQLITLTGDVGAKAIIAANADQLRLIECDDPGILMDIDEPGDLPISTTRSGFPVVPGTAL